jgi:hypothetical protein
MIELSINEELWDAQVKAALSGSFAPATLLGNLADDPQRLALVATHLARDCDVAAPGGRWLMRTPARRYVLDALVATDMLGNAIAERRKVDAELETRDLLDALSDAGSFSQERVEIAVTAGDDRGQLQRIVTALDRAGAAAAGREWLIPARSALAVLDHKDRRRAIERLGFFGREDERAKAKVWLSAPPRRGPIQCLLISGGPGMGKSSLLEAVVRDRPDSTAMVLRLDFDRAGLDVLDRMGLTLEAARQIGELLGPDGSDLIQERLRVLAELDIEHAKEERRFTPRTLAAKLTASVGRRGVLVVLDTLEVLRGRGETHVESLFEWLEDLRASGLERFHVIAAGRGDILDPGSSRIGERLHLNVLTDADVEQVLDHEKLRHFVRPAIQKIAQGHPLKLRLAMEIATHSEDALRILKSQRQVSAAYLYRFLLSRIPDPELGRLAYPGLIVRRLSSDILQRVIAPAVRLRDPGAKRAQFLFEELATQHWLMDADPGLPGFLKHRADMRAVLLPLLYSSQAAVSAKLDRRAAEYFEGLREPWARLEALYHRLQLLRRSNAPVPDVPQDLAGQFDEEMISELPPAGQDLVRRARGDRTTLFRRGSTDTASDERILGDLLSVIEKRNWAEGDYILSHLTDAGFDPASEVGEAVRALYWRSGRWAQAKRSLAERDRMRRGDRDLEELHPQLALVRLEMRAEFHPKSLALLSPIIDANPEWVDRASVSPDGVARSGALAFLLHSPDSDWRFRRTRSAEVDTLGALTERWARSGRDPFALQQAIDRAAERSRGWLAFRREGEAPRDGRLFAALTPYETPARGWIGLQPDARRLLARTEALREHLLNIGGLLAPGDAIMPGGVKDPIGAIAEMGLFAEWAQAAAWFWRNEDLRAIGAGAERWRRSAAGEWGYAVQPPRGWPTRDLDETLQHRLEVLERARDPVGAALEELSVWAQLRRSAAGMIGNEGERLVRQIYRGLPPALRAQLAENGHDPSAVMKRLQIGRVPSAFLPALSVLLYSNPTEWRSPR